jgi:hypothetical protein
LVFKVKTRTQTSVSSRFGFKREGFVFRAPGFVFRVSCFGFFFSHFAFRILFSGFRVPFEVFLGRHSLRIQRRHPRRLHTHRSASQLLLKNGDAGALASDGL